MLGYNLQEAITEYGLKPGDEIGVYIKSAGKRISGIYRNPIPKVELPGNTLFPLREDDLVTEINGNSL